MALLRWSLVIPAAIAANFIAYFAAGFAHALANGFEKTATFWGATDMNGEWISGTFAIIWVRGTSGAFSTWAAAKVAPTNHHVAARAWFVLLALFCAGMLVFGLSRGVAPSGIGVWYRSILELLAVLGGSAIVAWEIPKEVT